MGVIKTAAFLFERFLLCYLGLDLERIYKCALEVKS